MRYAIGLAAALMLAVPAGMASAETLDMEDFEAKTVGALADLCSADESTEIGMYAAGFCFGWLEGVRQFYGEMLEDERFNVQPVACPGRVVTRDEARQVFLEWANANPSKADAEPIHGAIEAAKAKFPCE